ncbi:MAG TPA: dihydrofolate reductase [Rhodothermales bacterium]|nr:dihydrofolate reductase [Rhodothermales bacterium]
MEKKPEIVIIAAVSEKNRVIGRDLDLPWHLSEDLKRFKRLTMGHPLIMGRRTFESLLHQFGGPLKNRRNIVLTSGGDFDRYPDTETYRTSEEALATCVGEDVVFIGGGATIYEHFLPLADRLELTLVEGDYEGDTYFPPYEHLLGRVFRLAGEERHEGFRFATYVRRGLGMREREGERGNEGKRGRKGE